MRRQNRPSRRSLIRLAALAVLASAANGEPAAENATLVRLTLVPGREVVQRVTSRSRITPEKSKSPIVTTAIYTLRQRINGVSDDRAMMECRIERLIYHARGEDQESHFDSEEPPSPGERADRLHVRGAIGKPFSVEIDSLGRVYDVRGAATVPNPNVNPNDSGGDPRLAELVGASRLRALLLSLYAWVPEKPIAVGQTWTRKESAPMGVLTLTRTNTLRLIAARADRLELRGRIDVGQEPGPGVVTEGIVVTGRIIPATPGAATIVFDPSAGALVSMEANLSFGLTIESAPKDKPKRKQSVMQLIDAETKVELISLNGQPVVPPPMGN